VGSSTKKIIVFGLALILAIGSLAGIFVALLSNDDDTVSTASSTSSSSTTSTTRVEFTGEGSEAFCQADAQLNQQLAQQAPTTTDPAALAAYEAYAPLLAAVGWDQSKVTAEQVAAIQTPEVTAAGQRLSQYTERVCRLVPEG
jgi:hypothetical protein